MVAGVSMPKFMALVSMPKFEAANSVFADILARTAASITAEV
jgi:hypothetical protein